MSMFDKAKDLAGKSKDKIAEGLDKATDVIDDKTGGKYSDKLQKVDDLVGKVTGQAGESDESDASDAASDDETPTEA